MKSFWVCLTTIGLLCLPTLSSSHHSTAPHYDREQPVSFSGVVTEFEFLNPHVVLHVDVAGENAEAESWVCISTAANVLRRQGWTETQFVPGQDVAVRGIAARRDPFGCAFTSVESGGITIAWPGVAEPAAPAIEVPAEPPVLTGKWMRDRTRLSDGRPAISADPDAFTPAGLAAQAGYDQRFDDPSFDCSAASITRAWGEPGTPTEIEQTDQRLIIRHEYMDTVRTIRLGNVARPANPEPRPYGYSIGWYEGSTLVIDSVGFGAGVLTPHPGVLHSDQLHIVERISLDPQEGMMELEWIAEDPLFFNEPLRGSNRFIASPFSIEPYGCVPEKAQR